MLSPARAKRTDVPGRIEVCMTDQCKNCGAELFAGQQFCRKCGAPAGSEQPTQILQPGQPSGAPIHTAPLSDRGTDPVSMPRSTSYQAPAPYQLPLVQSPPQANLPVAPRKGSARGWIVIFALLGVVALGVLGSLLYAVSTRRAQVVKRAVRTVPPPAAAGMPPEGMSGMHPPHAPGLHPPLAPLQPGETPFDEGGTNVSDNDDATVITRTFPLGDGATFSLKNYNGNITITGWDQPRAQVKVTKQGGSPEERVRGRVVMKSTGDALSLRTAAPSEEGVEYEVMLPRGLRRVEVEAVASEVKIRGIGKDISVDVKTGSVELENVSGGVRSRLLEGDMRVTFDGGTLEAAQEYTTMHGEVELTLDSPLNADLRAEAVSGDIDVDDHLGLKVEKGMVGQQVAGRLGTGGKTLSVKVLNGDIRIKK